MNILWPILVIIAGAAAWWLIKYLNAPKPFEVALVVVLVIALIWWLVATFGGGIYLPRP
jgi:hypothetical protein